LGDNEASPKKGAFTQLDDDDDSDNEGVRKSDGNNKVMDKEKRLVEATSLRGKLMT
jgi:hypothetical protein